MTIPETRKTSTERVIIFVNNFVSLVTKYLFNLTTRMSNLFLCIILEILKYFKVNIQRTAVNAANIHGLQTRNVNDMFR
jgi:hypothetical protein